MSYILNALKKAEQDRLRDDPKDLEDFASARWDPYQQQPSSNRRNYMLGIGLLLALGVGCLTYLGSFSSSPQAVATNNSLDMPQPPSVNSAEDKQMDQAVAIEPITQAVQSVPKLAITGHMYFAQGSPSNRLFANDQSYREGDRLVEDWVLLSIGLEGVEIGFGERVEFIDYP